MHIPGKVARPAAKKRERTGWRSVESASKGLAFDPDLGHPLRSSLVDVFLTDMIQ